MFGCNRRELQETSCNPISRAAGGISLCAGGTEVAKSLLKAAELCTVLGQASWERRWLGGFHKQAVLLV